MINKRAITNPRIFMAIGVIILLGWLIYGVLMEYIKNIPYSTGIATVIFAIALYLLIKKGVI